MGSFRIFFWFWSIPAHPEGFFWGDFGCLTGSIQPISSLSMGSFRIFAGFLAFCCSLYCRFFWILQDLAGFFGILLLLVYLVWDLSGLFGMLCHSSAVFEIFVDSYGIFQDSLEIFQNFLRFCCCSLNYCGIFQDYSGFFGILWDFSAVFEIIVDLFRILSGFFLNAGFFGYSLGSLRFLRDPLWLCKHFQDYCGILLGFFRIHCPHVAIPEGFFKDPARIFHFGLNLGPIHQDPGNSWSSADSVIRFDAVHNFHYYVRYRRLHW